jgi:hypothetical protein
MRCADNRVPDPPVPGLRYRVRPGGVFAEYRYKLNRKWAAKALGRLPTEAELCGETQAQLVAPI